MHHLKMQSFLKTLINFTHMLTLTFNTQEKTVKITNDKDFILKTYDNVPTVKVRNEGYYEIMQKQTEYDESTSIPVCRLPIQNTLMFIEK